MKKESRSRMGKKGLVAPDDTSIGPAGWAGNQNGAA
jgi:hypothetical protein